MSRHPKASSPPAVAPLPSDAEHSVEFFKRHVDDDPDQTAPGLSALMSFPSKVRGRILATLAAVAAAPPKRFAGGGQWEAMHGDMSGYFEVRVDSSVSGQRMHYRLFCLLDVNDAGREAPLLTVIDGASKKFRTTLPASRYAETRKLGDEYLSRNPRSLVSEDELRAALSA